MQQWQGDAPPFSAGRGGESGAVQQGKASREPPRHGAMRRVLGARVGSAAAGAGAGRVEGGAEAGSSALAPWSKVAGKLCASEGKERRASKHPQPRGAFLRAPRSRVPESCARGEHPHPCSPRATLLLGSGLSGARSGGAGPGPRSPASSGSGRSPLCSRRCRPGTGAQGRPPPRTR